MINHGGAGKPAPLFSKSKLASINIQVTAIMIPRFTTTPRIATGLAGLLIVAFFHSAALSQSVYVVDQFNPSGANGFSYSGGQIGQVWTNWFGTAFENLVWTTNDANSNANSGSMEINANFNGSSNQFEVYDGFNGINPPLNGLLLTNFQCSVRFIAGSATGLYNGTQSFGYLQFGVSTYNFGQDYFNTSINIPAADTNWVQVSIPISAASDLNLVQINNVLIHIYGPSYSPALSGPSTLLVDNIEFFGPTLNNICTVDWNTVFQRIDGFGASSAWQGSWNQSEANLFFSTNNGLLYTNSLNTVSTNNGIGLSLLRNHIVYANSTSASATPTTVETSIMQMAQALGTRVWSTPWTPAAGFKSTSDIYDSNQATDGGIDGGSYLGSGNNITNVNYASQLANYVSSMKNTYGVNLYAISIQNEPDADVTTYEACQWSAAQIHDFVTNLYSALSAKGVGSTKIIAPEDENWQTNLLVNTMSDPNVGSDVGIVACHNYDGQPPANVPVPLPTFTNPNAATWETEVSILSGSDDSITNGVYWAGRIHLFMTIAQVNAWHYWWLMSGDSTGNEALTDSNASPTKRMFALGQFSRFVRPNYYRIAANNNGLALVSAYKDSLSPAYAIVAINPNTTNIVQTFSLTNFPEASVLTPWITTSNLSLAPQSSIAVTNSSFTYMLPALSIVTFAGMATNYPPTLSPIQNQTVNPGVTVLLTNLASDVYAPPQTLTFNLLNAPTGASLNASNGIFSWRPPVSSANTTNLIMVEVSNSGTPALSATNIFDIIVNPLDDPSISSIMAFGQTIQLVAQGTQGPDYTLQTSTNLAAAWQTLYATNSPALPVTFTYTNSGTDSDRFFRIELGP
jgi:glucuronoarabinoxylan endo-1,4-beta-xylanase